MRKSFSFMALVMVLALSACAKPTTDTQQVSELVQKAVQATVTRQAVEGTLAAYTLTPFEFPTLTPTPVASGEPSVTDTPTTKPTSTPTLRPTNTPVPDTPTPVPTSAPQVVVQLDANLRAGPGTTFEIVGQVHASQVLADRLEVVSTNEAGDWYKLRNGAWVFASLVSNAPRVPVAAVNPTPPPATQTPTLAPVARATLKPAVTRPGLGVTRQAVQSVYEKPALGFTFKAGRLNTGEELTMGTSPDKLVVVDLIGPPEELTRASAVMFINTDNPNATKIRLLALTGLLTLVVPEWNDSLQWMDDTLTAWSYEGNGTGNDRVITVVQFGRAIKITNTRSYKMLTLEIQAVQ